MVEYKMDLLPGSYNHAPTLDAFARSFPFYCTDSGRLINGDRYFTKRDNYEGFLLLATFEGCGKVVCGGQSCVLEKGRAVIIDCGAYHEYSTLPGNRWGFYYMHFNALAMEGYQSALVAKLTPVKLRIEKHFWQLMDQVYQTSFKSDVISYAIQSNAISNILTELLHSIAEDHTSPTQLTRPDITKLAEYIQNNFTRQLSLDDFSAIAHLSKHHLIRAFKTQIGMSPYKYLHMCRINKAIQLLKDPEMSASQIAYAVGYNDPIVFTRHFKAFHNITPGEYRKVFILLPPDVQI